jgi:hypothetical protein
MLRYFNLRLPTTNIRLLEDAGRTGTPLLARIAIPVGDYFT